MSVKKGKLPKLTTLYPPALPSEQVMVDAPHRKEDMVPEDKKRFVAVAHAEQWWVEQARTNPVAFFEYVSGLTAAKHHRIWLANIFHPERNRINIIAPRESGKAQPLDAKVITPSGWKKMGDLQAGDFVFSAKGIPTRIVSVHPQGEKDIYRVSFTDGSSVECTDDHLWTIRQIGTDDKETYKTWTLNRIRTSYRKGSEGLGKAWLDSRGHARYHVPITEPVQFAEKGYVIPPYTMGILLGDGCLSKSSICISCADDEIIQRVASELRPDLRFTRRGKYEYVIVGRVKGKKNQYLEEIRRLGLGWHKSNDKFIPTEYLEGSVEQRIALLQGLMDSDGTVSRGSKRSCPVFCTVSPTLRDTFIQLVNSLGGTTKVNIKKPRYTYNGEYKDGQIAYNVSIKFNAGIAPFYLPRKAAMYHPSTKYPPTRGITDIEFVGVKPAQCISVEDKSGLYLTGHYIVTHNTSVLVYAMLWHIGRNPLSSNGIISVSSRIAEDRLRMIRGTLVDNPRFANVFPYTVLDVRNGIPNTQTELTVKSIENNMPYKNWRRLVERYGSAKDPTLVVGGMGGRGVGRRFSGILMLDDIIDEADLTDDAQEKAMRYVMQTVVPSVKDTGRIINIGTRWMVNDVPERLSNNPSWHTIEMQAMRQDENGDWLSYWPEVWPIERLEAKRREINNDAIFNIMYMNDPSAMTSSLFTIADLSRDLPSPVPPLRRIYITTDQAISMSKRADYNVYMAVGVDADNNYYILDMVRFKGDPETQLTMLSNFYDRVQTANNRPPDGVLFENIAMQSQFVYLLNRAHPHIPTYTHSPKGDKSVRAQPVSRAAKAGKLFINKRMPDYPELVSEWLNFPLAKHDDTLDPVGLLMQFLSKNLTVKEVRFIKI